MAALLGPSSAVLLVPQVGYVDYNHCQPNQADSILSHLGTEMS